MRLAGQTPRFFYLLFLIIPPKSNYVHFCTEKISFSSKFYY
nr:MAG TPA: hypothetical protein [Bacteriophage sp.]DAO41385.1 MAG TPA: hypothetical protein [Caudoviricetes sp.]